MTTATAVERPAPSAKSVAWYATLILIPLLTAAFLFWLRQAQMERNAHRAIGNYGTVPAFQLTNQDGQPFGTEQLNGKIWIVDFIFSTCPGPCPMISSRMAELQKPLEKTDVRLVSITVDPEKDTPEVLRGYADKLEAQPGWDFLTGPKAAIYDLSRSGFKLPVSESGDQPGVPVHTTRAVLVDGRGSIRGYYDVLAPDTPTKLVADANRLVREQSRARK
ncbi:MAG TPA: SCO family protein [Chthoniobacterales bacterium]|nr:SCO family protein [Chthoniobacterales bacterium]